MSHDHTGGGHSHGATTGATDRRWLLVALLLLAAFMVGELLAGLFAHSLALVTDAGHLLSDVVALAVAIIASRIMERPARGSFTYGFARVDALSGQASGITLLLLAVWFTVEAVLRLISPDAADGGVMSIVALVGVVVNVLATLAVTRADQNSLNIRGALSHLLSDLWAFGATLIAGLVIVFSGWTRADAVASLVVAALMTNSGVRLVRAAGRIFLEAAPTGLDPREVGTVLAEASDVSEVHDLHVWEIGAGETAVSAHVLVSVGGDCHAVGASLRDLLAERYEIHHVTLQVDHAGEGGAAEHCADSHGPVHVKS
jgi:cobalt-zinc-cadmium efflux system protein